MEERNDIVIYQSEDGLVSMEAMIDAPNDNIVGYSESDKQLIPS